MTSLLLQEIAPDFAAELHALLQRDGDVALAAQVRQLMIFERCRCGDSFCSTFYTAPRPEGGYPPEHQTLALLPEPDRFRRNRYAILSKT